MSCGSASMRFGVSINTSATATVARVLPMRVGSQTRRFAGYD
jgi:hypothetical protein